MRLWAAIKAQRWSIALAAAFVFGPLLVIAGVGLIAYTCSKDAEMRKLAGLRVGEQTLTLSIQGRGKTQFGRIIPTEKTDKGLEVLIEEGEKDGQPTYRLYSFPPNNILLTNRDPKPALGIIGNQLILILPEENRWAKQTTITPTSPVETLSARVERIKALYVTASAAVGGILLVLLGCMIFTTIPDIKRMVRWQGVRLVMPR